MSQVMIDRRGFLLSAAALAAGGACISLAGPALAFQVRPLSDYDGAVLEDACGQARYHVRLIKETEAALDLPADDPRLQTVIRQMKCPFCGCALQMPTTPGMQSSF